MREFPREKFGHRIRITRERRGLGQRELARLAAVHYTLLCHVEKGQRLLSIESLLRVADALDVPTDYLLGRTSHQRGTEGGGSNAG